MVSAGVPVPVVKALDDAVATQDVVSRPRSSATVTVPSDPVAFPPSGAEPRSAEFGTVIVSAPVVTVNVTVVGGSPPGGPPGAGACGEPAEPGPGRRRGVLVVTAAPG